MIKLELKMLTLILIVLCVSSLFKMIDKQLETGFQPESKQILVYKKN